VHELFFKEEKIRVDKVIVAGHSKRGHTSWLAAAVDSRIKGIIPIAIDVLNAPAQMPHHLKSFGSYNTPSEDATNFLNELEKPLGKTLFNMIDPYVYKDRLALPKLIVSATNDDYFPTDALNLYWSALKGNNSILYLSNAGHVGADSDPRVNPAAFAFVRAVAANKTLPSVKWAFSSTKDSIQIHVTTGASAVRTVLWKATSDSRDFRGSQWYAEPMQMIIEGSRRRYVISIPTPSDKNASMYSEVEFEEEGHKFSLSTQTYRYSKQ
jgi:PhoPQ-activated pathogenicity-related protein